MKTLDEAIDHVLRQIVSTGDPASLEKLANAVQGLTYAKWQYLQPSAGASALDSGRALSGKACELCGYRCGCKAEP